MQLNPPVTVTPPPFRRGSVIVKEFDPVTFDKLEIAIVDNPTRRAVFAMIRGLPKPLVLWSPEEYEDAGDWTQEQANARIVEKLGADVAATLASLYGR